MNQRKLIDLIFKFDLEAILEGLMPVPGCCTCKDCFITGGVKPPAWVDSVFSACGGLGKSNQKHFRVFVLALWKDTPTTDALDTLARLDHNRAIQEVSKLWRAFKGKTFKTADAVERHQSQRARRADGRAARVPDEVYQAEWKNPKRDHKALARKRSCRKPTNSERKTESR